MDQSKSLVAGMVNRAGLPRFGMSEKGQIFRRSTKFSTAVSSFAWTQDSDVLVIGTVGSGTELAEAGEIHVWHKNNWLPSGGTHVQVFHSDFLEPLTVGKPGYADLAGVRDVRVVGDQLTVLIQNANAESSGNVI